MKRTLAWIICILLLASAAGCGGTSTGYHKYSYDFLGTFDTVITVMGYTKTQAEFDAWAKKAQTRFEQLNKLYDTYTNYDGVNNIKTINDNAGKSPVKVSKDIISLIEFSRQWQAKTPAAINIAMGSVLAIWHDYREAGLANPENAELPPMDKLKAAAQHTDISKVIVDEANSTVYLQDPEMALEVGSVAKGYATEIVAQELRAEGWRSFIISSGGNVRAVGKPLDGVRQKWGVGITDPNKPNAGTSSEVLIDTAFVNDMSVTTAGDYQRYYTVNGKTYNHIIDPATLMPATNFRAVSVATKDSGVADFLDTVLFILPYEQGLQLVKSIGGVEALWIYADGTVKTTDGMKAMLKTMGGASSK